MLNVVVHIVTTGLQRIITCDIALWYEEVKLISVMYLPSCRRTITVFRNLAGTGVGFAEREQVGGDNFEVNGVTAFAGNSKVR